MKNMVISLLCFGGFVFAGPIPVFEDIGTLEDLGADPYKGMQLCFPYIAFHDWDGDGKNDVILGGVTYPSNSGAVYLFKNSSPATGTTTKFEAGVKMKAGGSNISLPSN